ncbi:cupin [Nostocoides sp. F2B08]|uniref:cupin domain-containing protein n=1 Tax=Nostocoides sp. F2B08 TaxID=2653936 RepID=UPI00126392EF|nr:cupin domain-containing protein [Tetrasphaera sp. F2B08]KAB7745256.1 cupin [Tetrasphaera sp. F2B08]
MTHTLSGEQPHTAAALPRLLGDVSVAEFAEAHWGRRPLRATAGPVGDLFSGDAVDELVSVRGLRAPFLRVAKDGRTFGDREFTSGGGVGATVADQLNDDLVWRHFEAGATLVLQALHRSYEPLLRFTQDLAADLGHPCQVNAYVTPPQNTGFSDHYDVHDVFVVQVEGEKRWRIREPVWPLPLRDQPWDQRRAAVDEAAGAPPLDEFVMSPGDVLYLPRGYLHSATAMGEVSIHLTIGVHQWTRHHIAEQLTAAALRRLADDENARSSLALGVDVADATTWRDDARVVRDALVTAIDALPDEAVAALLAAKARAGQRVGPLGPVGQLRAAREGTTRVELRAHLRPRLERDPLRLVTRVRDVPLERSELADVEKLLEVAGPVTVSPDLAERLLRAGVCIPSTL